MQKDIANLIPSKATGSKKPKSTKNGSGGGGQGLTSIYERNDLLAKLLDKPQNEFGSDDRIEAINNLLS